MNRAGPRDCLTLSERLLAARLATVGHASVTGRHRGAYATVAASSDLAVAIDQAQYEDNAGPCLEALDANYPAAVPDIAATMTWPGFRDIAARHGLKASLSIPLFAGSGRTIAALNLYGHEQRTMTPLISAVWATYDPDSAEPARHAGLGDRELTDGLAGALALRTVIQQTTGNRQIRLSAASATRI